MPKALLSALLVSALLVLPARADPDTEGPRAPARGPRLVLVHTWSSGEASGTEVISVQSATQRAVVTLREVPAVAILDLSNPAHPVTRRCIPIASGPDEEVTSVAFHPTRDFVFVVLDDRRPRQRGRLLVIDASSGRVARSHAVGFAPDHVAISPQGDVAIVANEGEHFWFNCKALSYGSMPGGFTLIDLSDGCAGSTARSFILKDQTGKPGMPTQADGRAFDRPVDLNCDGVRQPGEQDIDVPLEHHRPENLEAEYVAFSPDGSRAFVTLQENNAVVVVDPRAAKVLAVHGLGTTTHLADRADDGTVVFGDKLVAFREPDGIAVTPDGRHFVTADEGDSHPKASETKRGRTAGGGRTISLFDAKTGDFVADTANQIDEAAHAAGVYPDRRSDNKGSEPENLVIWKSDDRVFAAVALERAGSVALVELTEPSKPEVLGVFPLAAGSIGPEGLAIYRHCRLNQDGGRVFLYVANEDSGDVSVFNFRLR